MITSNQSPYADVTYRATVADGREAELHFTIDPAAATLAEAWAQLTRVYAGVDPISIEIEIRPTPLRTRVWALS